MNTENDIFIDEIDKGVVYGLFDNNEPLQIRYVGSTTVSPVERLKGHLNGKSKNNKKLKDWFTEVKLAGSKIGMRILGKYSVETLLEAEQSWIKLWELYCDNFNTDSETLKRNKKFNEYRENLSDKFHKALNLRKYRKSILP